MKKNIFFAVCCAVVTITAQTSCEPTKKGNYAHGSTIIACDATFQPILEQEINVFEAKYANSSILDLYVDEGAAIDSLLNMDNNVRMAIATRPLDKKEISYLNKNSRPVNQQAIAIDAIALIVNPENPISQIDYQDLVDILEGKFTTWDMIPGAEGSMGKIAVVFDHQNSSTTRYMTDSLLNGKQFGGNVFAEKSPRAVFEKVRSTKNAIGIIGVEWLSPDLSGGELTEEEIRKLEDENEVFSPDSISTDVKVLAVSAKDRVQAYLPDQYNIFRGLYPLYRQVYLISTSSPNTTGHSFFVFVTSTIGQKIILKSGICPKVISPQFVDISE